MYLTRVSNTGGPYDRLGFTRVPALQPALDPLYGEAYKPPTDPLGKTSLKEARSVAQVIYRDIPITTTAGSWSLTLINNAQSNLEIGIFTTAADLTDKLFSDDRIQATLGSRTGGLFGKPLSFHTGVKSDSGESCMAAWRAAWPTFAPQAVLAEVKRWAIMLGFAVCEIVWDTAWQTIYTMPNGTEVQAELWRPVLRPWHPKYIYWRWDIRRYVAMTVDGPVVIEPGCGKWFLHAPFGAYRGWMHGAQRAVSDKWYIKALAWRDWARYNERHGLPIVKAYVPATGDAVQKSNFVASLANLGQEAVLGLPQNVDETGYDAELLEARDRSWESFQATIDRAELSITLALKFQNLTTEVHEGSFAATTQHGHTDQRTLEFDEATLALDLYEQGARPFAAFNFGDPQLAPWSRWDVTPPEDFQLRGESWQKFWAGVDQMRRAGYKIKPRALRLIARNQLGVNIPAGSLLEAPPVVAGGLGQ